MQRKHYNHYYSQLSAGAGILAADGSCTVDAPPDAPPAGFAWRMQLQDALISPTLTEFVDVSAVSGGTLTISRASEDATKNPARDWPEGTYLASCPSAESFDLINGAEIKRHRVTVATGVTAALDRADGEIQPLTLTADTALTVIMSDGESMIVPITWAGFSITSYPAGKWFSDVPTPGTGETVLTIVKWGGVLRMWASTEVV